MKIIDFHTHIDDILYGGEIVEPYSEMVWTPANIFEASGYRVGGLGGPFEKLTHHLEVIYIHHRIQFGTLENLLKFMDQYQVEVSVLLPIAPLTDGFQYLKKARDNSRLVCFASVHPEDAEKEKKLKDQLASGCVGVKLHPPLQNCPPDHPGYFEILEILKPKPVPVIFHTGIVHYYPAYQPIRYGYGEPKKFEKLIQAFPEIPIVMAHLGMRQAEQVLELGRKYHHLYVDGSNQRLKVLKQAVDAFGKDRLIFGSDFPASRQGTPIKIGLKLTKNDPEFQEKYFWKNAQSLLEMAGK